MWEIIVITSDVVVRILGAYDNLDDAEKVIADIATGKLTVLGQWDAGGYGAPGAWYAWPMPQIRYAIARPVDGAVGVPGKLV